MWRDSYSYIIVGVPNVHLDWAGIEWADVVAFDAEAAYAITMTFRFAGFAWAALAIVGLIVLFGYYRGGDKWAWTIMLVNGVFMVIPTLLLMPPAMVTWWITLVSGLFWIVALLIGAREIFLSENQGQPQ